MSAESPDAPKVAAVVPFPQFNRLKQCRYGQMLYNVHDKIIGRSLHLYGEFSEGEASVFRQVVKAGQVVVEVGANIGAHTVLLAQLVGGGGRVIAFEPQRIVFQTLCANLALNSITNVQCFHAAAGKEAGSIVVPQLDYARENNFGALGLGSHKQGENVPVLTIDGLNLTQLNYLKIDVEGMEQEVLEGAKRTIAAFSPLIYVENDRKEKSESLIRFIDSLGYDMYWHKPPYFNRDNFAGNEENAFPEVYSLNMACVPKSMHRVVKGMEKVQVPE